MIAADSAAAAPLDPQPSAALSDLADAARRQGAAAGDDDYDYDCDPWG